MSEVKKWFKHAVIIICVCTFSFSTYAKPKKTEAFVLTTAGVIFLGALFFGATYVAYDTRENNGNATKEAVKVMGEAVGKWGEVIADTAKTTYDGVATAIDDFLYNGKMTLHSAKALLKSQQSMIGNAQTVGATYNGDALTFGRYVYNPTTNTYDLTKSNVQPSIDGLQIGTNTSGDYPITNYPTFPVSWTVAFNLANGMIQDSTWYRTFPTLGPYASYSDNLTLFGMVAGGVGSGYVSPSKHILRVNGKTVSLKTSPYNLKLEAKASDYTYTYSDPAPFLYDANGNKLVNGQTYKMFGIAATDVGGGVETLSMTSSSTLFDFQYDATKGHWFAPVIFKTKEKKNEDAVNVHKVITGSQADAMVRGNYPLYNNTDRISVTVPKTTYTDAEIEEIILRKYPQLANGGSVTIPKDVAIEDVTTVQPDGSVVLDTDKIDSLINGNGNPPIVVPGDNDIVIDIPNIPTMGEFDIDFPEIRLDTLLNGVLIGQLFAWLGERIFEPIQWLGAVIGWGFNALWQYLTYGFAQVGKILDWDVGNWLDQILDSILSLPETIRSIPENILQFIKDALEWAFALDMVLIQQDIDALVLTTVDRMPIFSEIVTLLKTLFYTNDMTPPNVAFTLPESFGGKSFELFDAEIFDEYMPMIRMYTSVTLWIGFMLSFIRRLTSLRSSDAG